MFQFPKVTAEQLRIIPLGETRMFTDCEPKVISGYIARIPDRKFTQARVLIVAGIGQHFNAQTVTRVL